MNATPRTAHWGVESQRAVSAAAFTSSRSDSATPLSPEPGKRSEMRFPSRSAVSAMRAASSERNII